jgi:hypothetical protein
VVGFIVAEGLGFYAAAIQVVWSSAGDWASPLASAAIGTLLLYKARALWLLHRRAWFMVVALSALGAAVDLIGVLRGYRHIGVDFSLVWSVVTLVYLWQPRIRSLFAEGAHAG